MKVSFKADYAIKALVDIGVNQESGVVPIKDISQRQDIPLKFLEQIFISLKKEGIVIAKRGKEGGYILGDEAKNIKIGKILRAVDGTLRPITCLRIEGKNELKSESESECDFKGMCAMRGLWQKVYEAVSGVVDNTSLYDLIEETEKLKGDYFFYQI
jgi:Rrf2 family protein